MIKPKLSRHETISTYMISKEECEKDYSYSEIKPWQYVDYIYFKDSNTIKFGKYLFSECFNLKSIIIPENVEVINEHCFDNCKRLKTVIFSNNLKVICEHAFNKCALSQIIIPKNNIDIKECAFENCESLISLYIPDGESFIDERICLNSHNVLIYTERDLKNKNENIIKLDSETYNKITNSVINQIKNMM